MTLLNNATQAKKFDTRVVERNVQRGATTTEELQKSLNDLPDDSENAEYTTIEALVADNSNK